MKTIFTITGATMSGGLSVLCAGQISKVKKLRKAGVLTRTEAVASYAVLGAGSVFYAACAVSCVKDIFTSED